MRFFLLPVSVVCLFGIPSHIAGDPQKEIATLLDDFHDAAAKADEPRYFGHFAPEGVFMGTDATERWTVTEFRRWASPYFKRGSAWLFVPRSRNVQLAPEGTSAWFDEVLDSEHYGECRGTGAVRKVDGVWKVAHYNLTVPVPNDLLGHLVRRIRDHQGTKRLTGPSRIFFVRHAEKDLTVEGKDPPLTEAGHARSKLLARVLEDAPVAALYSTEFQRTRDTLVPLATAKKLQLKTIRAAEKTELIRRLQTEHRGQTVVVSGHSNTIPELIAALGVSEAPTISDDQYDLLFLVTVDEWGKADLLTLHVGS